MVKKSSNDDDIAMRAVDRYKAKLVIDPEDLESSLVEQPKLFWEVADNHVQAVAERDSLKLKIEELHAALDQSIRSTAAKEETKITEAGIQQQIKDDADMRGLKDDHLSANKSADEWNALLQAISQRGYMLRELVQLSIRQMSMENEVRITESSVNALRIKQGDAAIERVREARNKKPGRSFAKR